MSDLQDESRQLDELLIQGERLLRFARYMIGFSVLCYLAPLGLGVFYWIRDGLGTPALAFFTMQAVLILTSIVPISEKRINPNKLPQPVINDAGAQRWSRGEALERFGPNGLEVRSFLCRLPLLQLEHWEMLRRKQAGDGESLWQTMRSWKRTPDWWDHLPGAEPRYDAMGHTVEAAHLIAGGAKISPLNLEDARYWALRTGRRHMSLQFSGRHTTFWCAVLEAGFAVVHRELLPAEVFAALYEPFEHIIPAATLTQ